MGFRDWAAGVGLVCSDAGLVAVAAGCGKGALDVAGFAAAAAVGASVGISGPFPFATCPRAMKISACTATAMVTTATKTRAFIRPPFRVVVVAAYSDP